ncbi:MAG TPA: glycosyltransferase [Fibrobacteria bacterium]|nr:glycosyltransferase [Fibrobacteria bacterium]
MHNPGNFRSGIRKDLEEFVRRQAARLGGSEGGDVMKIDLHCHDRNSDVPDETLGRILRVPETWLPTAKLLRTLKHNGADVLTITNHNNARSCWQALDRGEDVLPGAEFSCTLPDVDVGVHVLTFGFTPAQEPKLNRLRKNVYKFLEFAAAEEIPTVLAHPLNFHSPKGLPNVDLMDRFAVLFERFEGVNGQRESWQNLLTVSWLEGLDEEEIEAAGKRVGIRPDAFTRRPYAKRITGGSDCHMGIFPGSTGTLLHVPDWRARAGGKENRAALALEALRNGDMGPYGAHCEEEKLNVAFLDYFCQVALHMEDPGLLRLLLHRGTTAEKLQALAIANGMFELRRHRYTSRFLGLFHECLQGRKPGWFIQLMTSPAYKPLLGRMEAIAAARAQSPEKLVQVLSTALPAMFNQLSALLTDRVKAKVRQMEDKGMTLGFVDLLGKIELPTHFRALMGQEPQQRGKEPAGIDLGKWSDGLPFPALAAVVLGGSAFAASKVLYGKRPFVDAFARKLGKYEHPKRALWITDTLEDRNGVSHVLQQMLAEARRRDLPIDFLACSTGRENGLKSGDHLLLIPPVSEFTLPFYQDQVIRLPGMMDLQKTFLEGGYDRIICSTEAPMGALALYLKHAFNVPAYFYTHSDWLDFARRVLKYDRRKLDRLRRFLRAFYRRFDGVFLLNAEQKESFASQAMGLVPDRLHLTAHWADARFHPRSVDRTAVYPLPAGPSRTAPAHAPAGGPVLLYAGRLSEEKGVMDIPEIFRAAQACVPGARLAFAGTGPCLARLQAACPDAMFLGWLDADRLAEAYSAADLLLLPSWFDTFSCSLLEALGCGLPAVAFNTKGPRDILAGESGGLLAETAPEMAEAAAALLADPERMQALKLRALQRASDFRREAIMDNMLRDLDLAEGGPPNPKPPAKRPGKRKSPGTEMPLEQNQAFIGELLALMGG